MSANEANQVEQDVVAAAENLAKEAGDIASRYEQDVLGTIYVNAGDMAKIHRAIAFLADRLAVHERGLAGENLGHHADNTPDLAPVSPEPTVPANEVTPASEQSQPS